MKQSLRLCIALSSCAFILIGGRSLVIADDETVFAKTVAPFVAKHCVRCHGPQKQEGDLKLDGLDGRRLGDDAELWSKILERLATGDMPPAREPRPSRAELAPVVSWIHQSLLHIGGSGELAFPDKGNHVPHELLFGPRPKDAPPPASPARLWRISPYQYQALIGQVGGEGYKANRGIGTKTGKLPSPFGYRGGPGLQDYSSLYGIDEGQTEQMVLNARDLARRMFAITGAELRNRKSEEFKHFDQYHTPRGLEAMVAQQEELSDDQVTKFVDTISFLVLRRQPTDDEWRRYGDYLRQETKRFGNRTGMENALAAYVLHPAAMFRMELATGKTDEHGRTMLPPLELAYAITYALTDTPPHPRLLEMVKGGRLQSREDVRREVERLLADSLRPSENQPKLIRVLRFFQEYFGYTSAPEVFKDGDLLPPEIRHVLVNDTDRLIHEIYITDRQVLRKLLTTRQSFVAIDAARSSTFREAKNKGTTHPFGRKNHANEAYSLAVEDWKEQQPLDFPTNQRAGVLTQPSWLIAHSTNDSNHAIHRGKWIRERLLGGAIPDTPITVDAQLPDEPDKPLRERMRVTREEFCWKCHQRMDPLGLAFEMFDHWGSYRTEEFGKPVDTRGEVLLSADPALNGPVANAIELVNRLANSEYVEQVFVRHAFRYWMGRNETIADAPTLQDAWRAYHDNDGSMNALIASLLTSDSFLFRRAEKFQITKDK